MNSTDHLVFNYVADSTKEYELIMNVTSILDPSPTLINRDSNRRLLGSWIRLEMYQAWGWNPMHQSSIAGPGACCDSLDLIQRNHSFTDVKYAPTVPQSNLDTQMDARKTQQITLLLNWTPMIFLAALRTGLATGNGASLRAFEETRPL